MVSKYQAARELNYIFNGSVTQTYASTYYIALSTGLSTTEATATGGEVSGNGYARVALARNTNNFSTATVDAKTLSNLVAVTFPTSTASWGNIKSILIFDSLTSGNLLFYENLTTAKDVAADTTVQFDVGSVIISLT